MSAAPATHRPPFAYAIFDLDGVLVDTAEYHYLAWKAIADELGVSFDKKKNERLRGVPRMESLRIILEDLPTPPANLDQLADRKNAIYVRYIENVTPADLLPGVGNMLDTLRAHGIPMAVGSSSKNAKPVLQRLKIDHFMAAIVDGYGFAHAKPAPDVFLNAAKLMNAPANQCVVVEDAQAGIDAAKAAGMFAVGIARDEALRGADLTVAAPADIPLSLWIRSSTLTKPRAARCDGPQ